MNTTYLLSVTYDYANTVPSAGNTDALTAMIMALFSGVYLLFSLAILVIFIVANWRILPRQESRAGQASFLSTIPIFYLR